MNDVPLSLQNWTSPLDKCYAAFITGANTISAMGFEDPIRVYFEHETEMKYPNASTCVPSVTLPACIRVFTLKPVPNWINWNRFTELSFDDLLAFILVIWNRFSLHVLHTSVASSSSNSCAAAATVWTRSLWRFVSLVFLYFASKFFIQSRHCYQFLSTPTLLSSLETIS